MPTIKVKKITEAAIQKQYKLSISVSENESARFWTRFNIFSGIQFAGIIGILSNLKVLVANPAIFIFVMYFCTVISVLVTCICIRGIMSAKRLFKLIASLESQSEELLELVSEYQKKDKFPQYLNYVLSSFIAVLFSALWITGTFYIHKYTICIPE